MKYILSTIILSSSIYATEININKEQWNLIGTSSQIEISDLNLMNGETIWTFKNGNWFCYKENQIEYKNCQKTTSIEPNSGFWIIPKTTRTLTIPNYQNTETPPIKGWSLWSPSQNINIDEYSDNISTMWKFTNNNWKIWTKDNSHSNSSIEEDTSLNIGEGAWILNGNIITIGKDEKILLSGNFGSLTKTSSQNIEDIWTFKFKIDTSSNYSNINLGIKFIKEENDGSNDEGEFVYSNFSIENGKIVKYPDIIDILGKSDSQPSGVGTYFTLSNNKDIIENSITLDKNYLSLNLGYIMKNQNIVTEDRFKVKTNYKIEILSNKLNIFNSSLKSLSLIKGLYNFTNKKGISGEISIK